MDSCSALVVSALSKSPVSLISGCFSIGLDRDHKQLSTYLLL